MEEHMAAPHAEPVAADMAMAEAEEAAKVAEANAERADAELAAAAKELAEVKKAEAAAAAADTVAALPASSASTGHEQEGGESGHVAKRQRRDDDSDSVDTQGEVEPGPHVEAMDEEMETGEEKTGEESEAVEEAAWASVAKKAEPSGRRPHRLDAYGVMLDRLTAEQAARIKSHADNGAENASRGDPRPSMHEHVDGPVHRESDGERESGDELEVERSTDRSTAGSSPYWQVAQGDGRLAREARVQAEKEAAGAKVAEEAEEEKALAEESQAGWTPALFAKVGARDGLPCGLEGCNTLTVERPGGVRRSDGAPSVSMEARSHFQYCCGNHKKLALGTEEEQQESLRKHLAAQNATAEKAAAEKVAEEAAAAAKVAEEAAVAEKAAAQKAEVADMLNAAMRQGMEAASKKKQLEAAKKAVAAPGPEAAKAAEAAEPEMVAEEAVLAAPGPEAARAAEAAEPEQVAEEVAPEKAAEEAVAADFAPYVAPYFAEAVPSAANPPPVEGAQVLGAEAVAIPSVSANPKPSWSKLAQEEAEKEGTDPLGTKAAKAKNYKGQMTTLYAYEKVSLNVQDKRRDEGYYSINLKPGEIKHQRHKLNVHMGIPMEEFWYRTEDGELVTGSPPPANELPYDEFENNLTWYVMPYYHLILVSPRIDYVSADEIAGRATRNAAASGPHDLTGPDSHFTYGDIVYCSTAGKVASSIPMVFLSGVQVREGGTAWGVATSATATSAQDRNTDHEFISKCHYYSNTKAVVFMQTVFEVGGTAADGECYVVDPHHLTVNQEAWLLPENISAHTEEQEELRKAFLGATNRCVLQRELLQA